MVVSPERNSRGGVNFRNLFLLLGILIYNEPPQFKKFERVFLEFSENVYNITLIL